MRHSTPLRLCLVLLTFSVSCRRNAGIPEPGSKHYRDLVSAFYVGLAGLQAGEDVRARQGLTLASQLAPGEPASWANLGLLELRQQQYDAAIEDADTARSLAPEDSHIEVLLGLIESKRGNLPESIRHLARAVALDKKNVKALYALAQETERQGTNTSDRDARRLLDNILRSEPNNAAVLLDDLRLSAKLDDAPAVTNRLAQLQALAAPWSDAAKQRLRTIQTAASANVRGIAVQVQFLRNLLVRDVTFRQSLDAVRAPAGTLGEPFLRFLKIGAPSSLPAPSDMALRFEPQKRPEDDGRSKAIWAGSLVMDAKSDGRVIWADERNLHLDQGSLLPLPVASTLNTNSVATGDLNYDFKTDLVIATNAGLRIYQQGIAPLFADVASKSGLSKEILNGSYFGAWLFDIDLDGDLDIVLGSRSGPPLVLRNNGDGSFATVQPFRDIDGLQAFTTADIDGDGDPDVALLDKNGKLTIFSNERLGNYRIRPLPPGIDTGNVALASGDVNGDGLMDFVLLTKDARVLRISDFNSSTEIAHPQQAAAALFLADLDNNGSLDLIVGKQIFLSDGKTFVPLANQLPGECQSVLDGNGDGRLDLITANALELRNAGARSYHWQTIRTRASQTTGDQRINSYGLGGEVEVRSGLLTQKQSITSPVLHFGLGDNPEVSLARIVWPNGALQVEFDLKPDATALAQQRLKGSCPFLFAWNGARMAFVKDCAPWSPALGLHINAQTVAGIGQTQEWFKIPGSAIQPKDGFYDLRISAEYWETFYIDHYSFIAVDHPAGTEVFTDERFAVPSPPLKLYEMEATHPFEAAADDKGNDVAQTVARQDGNYLDTFGRGRYQGVTKDHWVELTLPADAPQTGPLYLVGSGWLHPTDATINIALGQSSDPLPKGMSIEVPDAKGAWQTARNNLGFPAGRVKNVVLNLTGLFKPGAPRRLRLRTNLEIYWDRLAWAAGTSEPFKEQRLELADATLEYRGFSKMSQANRSSPELPDYDAVEQSGPRWRDMEGYYTRYGDVRPLLEKIDDRILIANAGDELRLKVKAPQDPPAGWVRDLILIGDGWIKDGDYNSVFSGTVLPLPYHGMKEYRIPPRRLEDDPAYLRHPEDWKTFHTRYVGRELFTRALWQ